MRNPLKVDIIRDRGAMAREAAPGVIENVYRVQLMNTDEQPRRFSIAAEGLPGISVAGVEQPIAVGASASRLLALRLQVPLESESAGAGSQQGATPALQPGTHKIDIIVRAVDDEQVSRHEKSTFLIPE